MSTTPFLAHGPVSLYHGDCLTVLPMLAADSLDACVTDPPYGLEFMGKDWDAPWKAGFSEVSFRPGFRPPNFSSNRNPVCETCHKHKRGTKRCVCETPDFDETPADSSRLFQDWCSTWAVEVLRVLKPGAHLLAFGGTRTYHRLACAIEDAGFEIRDCVMYVFGSGFPKSKNLSGEWQGFGTALKPAYEPILVARKPLIGTVAQNVLTHGTGAINIDGCRIEAPDGRPLIVGDYKATDNNTWAGRMDGTLQGGSKREGDTTLGRWPANLIHDGSEEVLAGFPSARSAGQYPSDSLTRNGVTSFRGRQGPIYADTGSAARFFYTAKASKSERGDSNTHPTVKPLALMRWLVRLVTPPGGTVLDPFAGSGTTLLAATTEGVKAIGIEREASYCAMASKRLSQGVLPCEAVS